MGPDKISRLPRVTLPAGTVLYHGTAATAEFAALEDRPTWFCLERNRAVGWAGWASEDAGRKRCLKFRLTADVSLLDTVAVEQWEAVCEAFTGDPDPGIGDISKALRRADEAGWFGRTEIMLTRPAVAEWLGEC